MKRSMRVMIAVLLVLTACTTFGAEQGLQPRNLSPDTLDFDGPLDRTPVATFFPPAAYPPTLASKGITGSAIISFTVASDGAVKDLKVESATEVAFGEAAVASASRWRFIPAMKDGRPCEAHGRTMIEFSVAAMLAAAPLGTGDSRTKDSDEGRVALEFHQHAEFIGTNTVLGEDLPQFLYLKPAKYELPKYPDEDRRLNKHGSLMVNCVVKETGEVESFIFTEITATGPMTQEVGKVVRRWVFPKIAQKGKHVRFVASLPVVFGPDPAPAGASAGPAKAPDARPTAPPTDNPVVDASTIPQSQWEPRYELTVHAMRQGNPAEVVLIPGSPGPTVYQHVRPGWELTTRPRPRTQPPPSYPHDLAVSGVGGRAVVAYVVDTHGRVTDARVLDASDKRFARAALEAVAAWTYDAGTLNGKATAALLVEEFTFRTESD